MLDPDFAPPQAIVLIQQKRGVRGRSGICTQKRLPNAPLALFVVTAAVRAVTLLSRFARNPATTGLAIHHLKSISDANVLQIIAPSFVATSKGRLIRCTVLGLTPNHSVPTDLVARDGREFCQVE